MLESEKSLEVANSWLPKFSIGGIKSMTIPLGIFFIISSTLVLEISLIRIFSVTLYNINSFLAISSALLGLALGGVIVYLLPEKFRPEKLKKNLSIFSLVYPVTIILLILLLAYFEFSADHLGLFGSLTIFSLATLPFVIANILLSFIFKVRSKEIGKLYFFDLIGAGSGVVAASVLMNYYSAINVLIISCIIGLFTSCLFNLQVKKLILLLVLTASLFGLLLNNQHGQFLEIKSLYNKFSWENTNVSLSKWNSFSHIVVDQNISGQAESLPKDLGLSLPPRWGIRIDGNAYTEINQLNGDIQSLDYLKNDLSILGFQLAEPGQALIVGPGGGRDVLMGLLEGHKVTAVEINPIIVKDVMLGQAREFSGDLYSRPDVNLIISEGRSFISQDTASYEVISIPLVDTWSSTTGGNLALVENNLYTVEAFEQYLSHLEPGGILTISRWDYDGAKLVTLFLEAAKNLQIRDPEKNIAIAKMNRLNNYLFKTEPFTLDELNKIKNFSSSINYTLQYLPGEAIDSDYTRYLSSNDKREFVENYRANIKPAYDNQPFFFFTIPDLKSFFNPMEKYQDGGLITITLMVTMFTLFLVIFPIFVKIVEARNNLDLKKSARYIIYFVGLGLSFIFIEIALIQKFILYLEKPIYSYSVVLTVMLVAAGAGSLVSQKINFSTKNLLRIVGLISILVLLSTKPLKILIIDATISLPIFYKILLTALTVAPISVLMGILLPMGIKKIDLAELNQIIPWAWSLNGAASVLGSVLSIVIAIFYGFNAVLITGGILYLTVTAVLVYEKR